MSHYLIWIGIADDENVIRFCLEISNEVVKQLRVRSKICWNSYAQNFHCSHGSPFPFSLLKDRKIRHDCTRLSRTVWRCCGCRGIIHVTESDPLMDVSHSLSVLQVDVIGLYRHAKWLTEPGNWMCTRISFCFVSYLVLVSLELCLFWYIFRNYTFGHWKGRL